MANMHCQMIEKTLKCALVTKSRNRQISPRNGQRSKNRSHMSTTLRSRTLIATSSWDRDTASET